MAGATLHLRKRVLQVLKGMVTVFSQYVSEHARARHQGYYKE